MHAAATAVKLGSCGEQRSRLPHATGHSSRTSKTRTARQQTTWCPLLLGQKSLLRFRSRSKTVLAMNVKLLTPRGHPRCAAAVGGGRQHAQTAIRPISSRQPAARSVLLNRPTQVCGHSSCSANQPVCLQQPACSHRWQQPRCCWTCCCQTMLSIARSRSTSHRLSAQHAHPTVCLPAGGQQRTVANCGGGVANGQISHKAPARGDWPATY